MDLKDIVVALDPGHGGYDPGACGNGLRECDINLIVALKLRDKLRAKGFTVVMTRESDVSPGGLNNQTANLQKRCDISDNAKATIYVSIHVNAGGGKGAEVLCFLSGGKGQALAQAIADQVCAIMGVHGQKLKDGSHLYVVKNTDAPACLVELGFIDTASDAEKIKNSYDKLADAVYIGICNNFGVSPAIITTAPPVTTTPISNSTSTGQIYRIRKTWEDAGSQLNAYRNLDSAKAEVDHNPGYSVFDESGKVVYPITTSPTVPDQHLYRVRLTWEDAGSQLGAYHLLDGAKAVADAHEGYEVYDENGVMVYEPKRTTPPSPPVFEPIPEPDVFVGTPILGASKVTANQLEAYMHNVNPNAPFLAHTYVTLEQLYGIRADVAFVQMCKETNFFRFTGRVPMSANNPAGLGATDSTKLYETFPTIQQGIEAQFQHLYAYATITELPYPIVDTRFKLVTRGIAPFVEHLGIQENPEHKGWASDAGYGYDIVTRLNGIAKLPDVPFVENKPEPEKPPVVVVPPVDVTPIEPKPAISDNTLALIGKLVVAVFKALIALFKRK